MRPIAVSALALGFVIIALPAFGSADEFTNGTSGNWNQRAAAGQAGQPMPADSAPEPSGGNGPASDAPEKKAPSTPMAGYAYGNKGTGSTATAARPRPRYRTQGPVVNMPGFEQTADGGSRLFVQLSQNVPVEERKSPGSITYVLKGASPRVWNNTNALVTVHFNTPVSRARLVPAGKDVHFVIDLRAEATPTWKMTDAGDKGATLTIDFPKGDYLQPAGGGESPSAEGGTPAPGARHGKRGHGKGGKNKAGAAPAAPPPAASAPSTPAPSGPKP
jgi:hypothetical protein